MVMPQKTVPKIHTVLLSLYSVFRGVVMKLSVFVKGKIDNNNKDVEGEQEEDYYNAGIELAKEHSF